MTSRKALEQCAWDKTPRDERRAVKTSWLKKRRLQGNEREIRVFNPSGETETTMSPWMPLWGLYRDELEQRCREEQEPKLRPPYARARRNYTGNVENDLSGRRR